MLDLRISRTINHANIRPIFQVAATREGSGIRIINEPLEGSSVFLVETGESRTPRPEEAARDMLQA